MAEPRARFGLTRRPAAASSEPQTIADLQAKIAQGGALDPDLHLRLASAYLRVGRHRDAARELDLLLAAMPEASRARLTAVVLRQRVRNLIVQRELLEADGIVFDDPLSPPSEEDSGTLPPRG